MRRGGPLAATPVSFFVNAGSYSKCWTINDHLGLDSNSSNDQQSARTDVSPRDQQLLPSSVSDGLHTSMTGEIQVQGITKRRDAVQVEG
eukprot:3174911-Rhodomonas_salina.1